MILLSVVLNLILITRVRSQSKNEISTWNNNSLENEIIPNYENLTRIEEILELFSVSVLGKSWNEIHKKINNKRCAKDMTEYLKGLAKRKIWAIKSKWSAVNYI